MIDEKLFFKIFFETNFLFHEFTISFHEDSCVYWNQSQINEGDKLFCIVYISSMGLHCF